MFSLPVDLGVNSRSPCGSDEHQITVVLTSKVKSRPTMSNPNLQGRGKEGTRGGGPPEITSSGRGGGRFGRGTGRFGMPRTSTLQPRQRFEGDIP